MTADVELLSLPTPHCTYSDHSYPSFKGKQMTDYALANVAHATAAKDAEIEALRAEIGLLRHGNVAYSQQVADLIGRAGSAEARTEALRKEVEAARGRAAENLQRAFDAEAHAERLAEALRDVMGWVSTDNYFTDEPMQALASARAALHPTAAQENDDA